MKILIVSGFLGAGKTTFIKRLARNVDQRFAILENEYGAAGIDGARLGQNRQGTQKNVWEMTEQCICCIGKKDFAASVLTIANVVDPEYLIVEPTGVGSLAPSEPETLPPSAEVHPAGAFPLSGSESFPGHSLQPLNTDSCGSLCGASSLCPRRAPLHTFSGFWLRTVSSVHTSDWSVPFLRSLLFRIILFSLSRCSYIPLSATFVPLATVWIAPAVHVIFGIQEHKKRLLS